MPRRSKRGAAVMSIWENIVAFIPLAAGAAAVPDRARVVVLPEPEPVAEPVAPLAPAKRRPDPDGSYSVNDAAYFAALEISCRYDGKAAQLSTVLTEAERWVEQSGYDWVCPEEILGYLVLDCQGSVICRAENDADPLIVFRPLGSSRLSAVATQVEIAEPTDLKEKSALGDSTNDPGDSGREGPGDSRNEDSGDSGNGSGDSGWNGAGDSGRDGSGDSGSGPGGQYLYIVGDGGLTLKIGRSRHPAKRQHELRRLSGRKLELLLLIETSRAKEVEGVVHHKLSRSRMAGEWFECSLEEARSVALEVAQALDPGARVADPSSVPGYSRADFCGDVALKSAAAVGRECDFAEARREAAVSVLDHAALAGRSAPQGGELTFFVSWVADTYPGEEIHHHTLMETYALVAATNGWPPASEKALTSAFDAIGSVRGGTPKRDDHGRRLSSIVVPGRNRAGTRIAKLTPSPVLVAPTPPPPLPANSDLDQFVAHLMATNVGGSLLLQEIVDRYLAHVAIVGGDGTTIRKMSKALRRAGCRVRTASRTTHPDRPTVVDFPRARRAKRRAA